MRLLQLSGVRHQAASSTHELLAWLSEHTLTLIWCCRNIAGYRTWHHKTTEFELLCTRPCSHQMSRIDRDSDCAWFSRSLLPLCCSSPRTFYHATTSCRIRSGLKCKKHPAVAKLSSLFGHIRAYKRCWGLPSVRIPAQCRLVGVSVMYVWTKLWSLMKRPDETRGSRGKEESSAFTHSIKWLGSSSAHFFGHEVYETLRNPFDPFNSRLHCLCLIWIGMGVIWYHFTRTITWPKHMTSVSCDTALPSLHCLGVRWSWNGKEVVEEGKHRSKRGAKNEAARSLLTHLAGDEAVSKNHQKPTYNLPLRSLLGQWVRFSAIALSQFSSFLIISSKESVEQYIVRQRC